MASRFAFVLIFLFFSVTYGKSLPPGVEKLARAAHKYAHSDFASCAKILNKFPFDSLLNPDAALFLRAQCRFYSGDVNSAKNDFKKLQARFPKSPHAALAAWREADCAWELGLKKQAVALYSQAQSGHLTRRADPAVGFARRAMWYYLHGKRQKGDDLWFALRKNYPLHPLATDSPPGQATPVFSFDQSVQLAESLRRSGSADRALEVLEPIEPKNHRQKYRFLRQVGLVLFDTRENYLQAAQILFRVRDHARYSATKQEAWFYGSRALGRADRDKEAIESHLAMVDKYPRGKYSARALFYAGWLNVNQGRCDDAQPILHRVERQYPSSKWARKAAWFSAWCYIHAGHWTKAIGTLTGLSSLSGYESGGRAAYWRAVALDESGQHARATKSFLNLLDRFPLTWYSHLARLRLGDHAPVLAAPPLPLETKKIHDPLIQKTEELLSAGLIGFASQLLREGESKFLARHRSDAGLLTMMRMYTRAQDANRPWYLAVTRKRRLLRSMPDAKKIMFWRYAYPTYKRKLLVKYSDHDLEMSLFLQAIMRTESGFDQMALSPADARGLLQMLPATARQIAMELGLDDFNSLDLFIAETNIQTAAWYIGRLVKRFNRQWPLAAASYNGGQSPLCKWLSTTKATRIDEFVEQIPYSESRRYAKRVFTAMLRYAWLENKSPPALNMYINTNCKTASER